MIDIVRRIAGFVQMVRVAFYLHFTILQAVLVDFGVNFFTELAMLKKRRVTLGQVRLFLSLLAILLSFFECLDDGDEFAQGIQLKTESLDGQYVLLKLLRIIVLFDNFFVEIILFGFDIVFCHYVIIIRQIITQCSLLIVFVKLLGGVCGC